VGLPQPHAATGSPQPGQIRPRSLEYTVAALSSRYIGHILSRCRAGREEKSWSRLAKGYQDALVLVREYGCTGITCASIGSASLRNDSNVPLVKRKDLIYRGPHEN